MVWKGSVGECLDNLCSRHNGAQFFAVGSLGKFFPPWTVSRDFWHAAVDVKLFHEAGCRLVHRYRIYKDPLPHPALRGRVLRRLLGFGNRAVTVAWLTHLHITIRSSGSTSEPVPPECLLLILRRFCFLRWRSRSLN